MIIYEIFWPPRIDHAAAHEADHHRTQRNHPHCAGSKYFLQHFFYRRSFVIVIIFIAGVELAKPCIFRRVFHPFQINQEEHGNACAGNPKRILPWQTKKDQRYALKCQQQSETNQHAEDTGKCSALTHMEPLRIHFNNGQCAERLKISVDAPDNRHQRQQHAAG